MHKYKTPRLLAKRCGVDLLSQLCYIEKMAKKKMTLEDLASMTKRVNRNPQHRLVYRYEFEDVLGRILNIEKKLKIKSGK